MHEHVEDVAGIVSRFCIRKRAQSYHQQPDGVARRGMSLQRLKNDSSLPPRLSWHTRCIRQSRLLEVDHVGWVHCLDQDRRSSSREQAEAEQSGLSFFIGKGESDCNPLLNTLLCYYFYSPFYLSVYG